MLDALLKAHPALQFFLVNGARRHRRQGSILQYLVFKAFGHTARNPLRFHPIR